MPVKIEKAVRQTTLFVLSVSLVLSALMQAIFLIAGYWDYRVLLGNLWGGGFAVLNFFLMGLSVQRAVEKPSEDAAKYIKASGSARMLALFVLAAIGAALPFLNTVALLIPLFFPRIAAFVMGLRKQNGQADPSEKEDS
jgi:predicted permease